MKNFRLFIFLIIIFSVFFNSCKKVDDLLTFEITDEIEITIENNILPFSLPFEIPTPPITTNSESEIEQNNSKIEYVKNIKLLELNLTITSPENKTFSFLRSIHIFISTNNQEEIELAFKDNISSDLKKIELTTSSAELDDYVKSPTYNIRTEVVTRETLTQDVDIFVFMKYQITANIF